VAHAGGLLEQQGEGEVAGVQGPGLEDAAVAGGFGERGIGVPSVTKVAPGP
jgi:hypothetical protein